MKAVCVEEGGLSKRRRNGGGITYMQDVALL